MAETMATLRLLNCEDFAPGARIAPHRRATVNRCAGQAWVGVAFAGTVRENPLEPRVWPRVEDEVMLV